MNALKRLDIYLWVMLGALVIFGATVIALPAAGSARVLSVAGARLAAAAVSAFFVARAFRAARTTPGVRGAWILFSLGLFAWLAAEGISFHKCCRPGADSYPFMHDGLWAVGYAFVVAALILKIVNPPRGAARNPNAIAGAGACAALLLILIVNFVVVPALRNPETTGLQKFWDVFFGVADFTLAAGALVLIAIHGGSGLGRPWAHISLGLLLYAVGDLIFLHLTAAGLYGPAGNLVTALFWVAAYLLVGFGAYQRRLLLRGEVQYPEKDNAVEGETR